MATPDDPTKRTLAYLTTNDVKPFLGLEPFFGQGKDKGQLVESSDVPHSPTEAARHHDAPVVFLGLQEPPSKSSALPSSDFAKAAAITNLDGTPYFTMDIAELELAPEQLKVILDSTSQAQHGILDWSEPRIVMSSLDDFSGGLFAEARSLVDWNQRNKVCFVSFHITCRNFLFQQFCPGCGARTYSIWGGWKLSCSTLLPWADNAGRKPCITTYDPFQQSLVHGTLILFNSKGLHNFTHPRIDPVVIMIAIDQSGEKILLGRSVWFSFAL